MTDIINEEENTTPLPEEEQETVVVDNGQTYESAESAIIAKEEADRAKLWAQESERQANIATRGAEEAGQAKDDAISAKNDAVAAKEYAEEAVTDINLITVATDLRATPSNIKTVANNISDVTTVAGISSNVTTVAGNTTNINTVAGVSGNVTTVATNILNVNNVSSISSAVVAVSEISSDVTTVAENTTDISTVAGISNAVIAVANNNSDVTTVSTNISSINTTATNINAVNTAANNIVAIQNASANAQLARDWAIKMNGLVSGEDYSAKYWADQARQAAEGAIVDNISINRNTDDELQTIGVINQNETTTSIKTWTGTLAQYNAIATKDSNTLYHITDDNTAVAYQAYTKSEVDNLISAIYPVGSIYIGTQSTCPLATLINGSTWVKVSEGRVLQGSDNNHNAGTTIAAGLPNITGDIGRSSGIGHVPNVSYGVSVKDTQCSGAFYPNNNCGYTATRQAQQGSDGKSLGFDASRSSSIYGRSSTVQPPAYVVNIWQRTA
jgi:hypothetical protein